VLAHPLEKAILEFVVAHVLARTAVLLFHLDAVLHFWVGIVIVCTPRVGSGGTPPPPPQLPSTAPPFALPSPSSFVKGFRHRVVFIVFVVWIQNSGFRV